MTIYGRCLFDTAAYLTKATKHAQTCLCLCVERITVRKNWKRVSVKDGYNNRRKTNRSHNFVILDHIFCVLVCMKGQQLERYV